MNALLLLLFAAMLALFGGQQWASETTEGGDIVGEPDEDTGDEEIIEDDGNESHQY